MGKSELENGSLHGLRFRTSFRGLQYQSIRAGVPAVSDIKPFNFVRLQAYDCVGYGPGHQRGHFPPG